MIELLRDWRAFRKARSEERQRAAMRKLVEISRTPELLKERSQKYAEIIAADPQARQAFVEAKEWQQHCAAHAPVHDAAILTSTGPEDEWHELQLSITMLDTLIVKELREMVAARAAMRRAGFPDNVIDIIQDSLGMLDHTQARIEGRQKLYERADILRARMVAYPLSDSATAH